MVWFLLQIFFSLNWSQQKWSWNGSKLGQLLSWITSSPQKSIWRFSEIGVTPKSAILDWDFPLSTNHLGGFPIYGNPKHGFPKMGGPPIFSINWVSSHKASIFSDTSIYGHPNKNLPKSCYFRECNDLHKTHLIQDPTDEENGEQVWCGWWMEVFPGQLSWGLEMLF